MPNHFLFFLFLLLVIHSSIAYGDTVATANLLPPGETSTANDQVILDNDSTYDVSANVITVEETVETVGGQEVELTQEVKFKTSDGDPLLIANTALPTAIISIPDETTVKAPDSWNGEITPPKLISTTGTIEGNFLTPTSSILVGSPDVILVFDTPVILILNGTTGTTAYKLPGGTQWILISTCTGTFENPNNPPINGECSIGNGVDTKIVTYHFTEFAALTASEPATPTPPSSGGGTSGGHGNTGVGSPRVFGGSSGGGGGYYAPTQSTTGTIPPWFDFVIDWYREGKISAMEFLNAYQWVVENIVKS